MRPDEGDLDEEIRGHLAINIKERIDRGEDPVSARRAALLEFGYVPAVRDQMRRVWYSRWYDEAEALARDIRFAVRSLVLLRPLVNREADRLIYIRQGAQGLGIQNLTFSVPEINDFKSRAGWWRRADHARHEPPSADLCHDSARMHVRAACGSRHAGHDIDGIANREHRL
jgi:hypothetical protein